MFQVNDNYQKLPGSYLFSTIAKKVNAYSDANPDKKLIRLGIGDVTQPIAPAILEADVLVFAMPVNWYSIPAQIKAVIDRIYSLVVGGKDIAGKECALIACCEEEDPTVLDGVRVPMERTCALNKWDMVGEVLVPGVLNKDDIEKTDGCVQAAALAEKI